MQIKVKDIAQLIGGSLEGDGEALIHSPGKIEEAGEGQIVFFANPKYENYLYSSQASAILVPSDFVPKEPVKGALIRVENVYSALGYLLEKFEHLLKGYKTGISKLTDISDKAVIGQNVYIGSFVSIEDGAKIGDNVQLMGHNHIGAGTVIGNHTILYNGVKVYHQCEIGSYCVIHANTVIGSDGFGFSPEADGTYKKIPQIGNVIIGNRVEIGANTVIDRATMGSTIVHDGVKLDNLIQVGHNAVIKYNTVIAAQAGIAGSTTIGKNCRIGGQVGFSGHQQIGDSVQIQAQSGIVGNIENGAKLFGSPAIPYTDYIKSYAIFKKLPEIYKRVGQLEKKNPD